MRHFINRAWPFGLGLAGGALGAFIVLLCRYDLLSEVSAGWAAAMATSAAVVVALIAPRAERQAQLRRAQQEDVRAVYSLAASCSELLRRVNDVVSAGQWSEDASVAFLPLLQLSRDTSRRLDIRSVPQGEIGPIVYTLRGTIEMTAALAEMAARSLPEQIDPKPMRQVFADFATLSEPIGALAARHGLKDELRLLG